MQQVRRKERGFTIIELVVVILLLGILAAVALPRFINVTDRAYGSAVQGVYGGFATGIAMYRAQYTANGERPDVTIDGNMLTFADTGYPAIADVGKCVDIWNKVLQSGRPSIKAVGPVDPVGAGLDAADLTAAGALDPLPDFAAFYDAGPVATCYYVYTAQYGEQTGTVAPGDVTVIKYDQDGRLELTNATN